MASTINGTSTGNGGLITTGDDSGVLNIQTNETTAITVDASQNVGIGVVPSAWYPTYKAIEMGSGALVYPANSTNVQLWNNLYINSSGDVKYKTTGIGGLYSMGGGGNAHIWYSAASGTAGATASLTQAMTLDSSGNLLVGATSAPSASATSGRGFMVQGAGCSVVQNMDSFPEGISYNYTAYTSGTVYPIVFRAAGLTRGYINFNGSVVGYVTSSDRRLKTNIEDADAALPVLGGIQVRKFNWKSDNSLESYGLIAQELAEIYPSAVSEGEEDADENIDKPWGVDPSKMVALCIKAIQEQQAIITTLTERITALEAK